MRHSAWLVFMVMLGVGIALWMPEDTEASSTGRYLVMQNQFVFEYTNEEPYTIIRPMCWDATLGWCDSGMDERGLRLVYLVDFELGRHGVIMQNSAGCFVWWLRHEYGADNQPHVQDPYWINCEEF